MGYGVVCYLRLVDDRGNVEVSLIMGKSRVSPLKPTTVPRLELTAATVAVKISAMLEEELKDLAWFKLSYDFNYVCLGRSRVRH